MGFYDKVFDVKLSAQNKYSVTFSSFLCVWNKFEFSKNPIIVFLIFSCVLDN